ncbi:tyrosine-type recombinase/integrase [Companilactobacillus crustorum]|uniref:tyrosine-type recombinase/integrase n=1 Tax=Companilactobacillus crustorum TaxID=392416 RepID=UPI00096A5F6D|nr:site-specific integrase [Companilactobacillus crustorum]
MKKINAIKSYTLKNGQKKYRFTIRIDKKHVTSRNGFYTYDDAALDDAALAYLNLKQEIMENKYRVDQNLITFKEVYDDWMPRYRQSIRDTTYFNIHRSFEHYILPLFGKKYVNKITIRDCQEAVDDWINTIASYKPLFLRTRKILDEAVRLEYIDSNPMRKIVLPTTTVKIKKVIANRREKNFYSLEELQRFLDAAHRTGLQQFAYFRTVAYTGMRRGESLILKWSDIDFDKSLISVTKTLVYSSEYRRYEIHPTKNGLNRTLIMDDETMEILSAWKEVQKSFKNNDNLVFTNRLGNYWSSRVINDWQQALNNDIGLNRSVTMHGLRHTHATLLYDMNPNITPKDVQKRLGHRNVDTTMNIYEHTTENSDGKILNALNDLDKKSATTSTNKKK